LIGSVLIKELPEYHFQPGSDKLVPYLEGVYNAEKNENYSFRWTNPVWAFRLANIPSGNYQLKLTALSLQSGPVKISDGQGMEISRSTISDQLKEYSFEIPSGVISRNQLILVVNSPAIKSDSSKEGRDLGLLLKSIELVPQNYPFQPSLPVFYNVLCAITGIILLLLGFYTGRGSKIQSLSGA
jgi:hypothetical protein